MQYDPDMDVGPDVGVGPLSLRQILGAASFVGTGDIRASRVVHDTREIRPGDVYFAIQGRQFDGRQLIEAAIHAGASAVVVDRPMANVAVPQCIVADPRDAFARVCMSLAGNPQRSLTFAGVTGTNGKTTTTWLLRSIMEAAGLTTGLIGTIEYSNGMDRSPASLTTPSSDHLSLLLSQMKSQGASHCVMEVSSHALDQSRCASIELSTAAITNVTRDHFDYHGDRANYTAAKEKIIGLLRPGKSLLLGIDDPGCREIHSRFSAKSNLLTFGFDEKAALQVQVVKSSMASTTLRLCLLSSSLTVQSRLIGQHNALNTLLAAGMAEQLQIDPSAIADGLERLYCVPGRMERIDAGQKFSVLVDYAHTPDGIRQCVATARSLSSGRVILVFGAGGNRDRAKRPLMAQAAESADLVIVTSDNPRSEAPLSIISDICAGFHSMDRVSTCVDRHDAIRNAIHIADEGDVVVIAGRGHESTQEIGARHISFDDRKVTRRLLLELLNNVSSPATRRSLGIPA